jgi:ATP-dependent Lhr-like helicase
VVRYESLREMTVEVSRERGREPKIAVFMGIKMATSTLLSDRVQAMLADPDAHPLPRHTADWLAGQRALSKLPEPGRLLIESFPREGRAHTCVYGFAGRNAQQTLGLLMTQRMEAAGLGPLGFVATDYATLIWGLRPVTDPAGLVAADGLRAALETWLAGNAVMKRTFRSSAIIAGLIERTVPGRRKTGRQATFSSDILYDTLRKYDPDHLMLRITRAEAMRGLVDFGRIEAMLAGTAGRIDHVQAPHVTPLAAPLLLEAGRVPIAASGEAELAEAEAARLMAEAGLARD